MLFGSAALLAILMAGGIYSSARPAPCAWGGSSSRCAKPLAAAPLPALDLRQPFTPQPSPVSVDLLRKKFPIQVTSVKVCGDSGFGVFAPNAGNFGVGVSATAFKTGPHERALQVVAGILFRF